MTGLSRLDRRFRPYADALLRAARQLSGRAYVASTRRSRREQVAEYNRFLTRGGYPAARPGHSKHERGLALDLGGLSGGQLRALGHLWTGWGGRWGGTFSRRDPIHFESS